MTTYPSRFLATLNGEVLPSPPIWFMRQAGRYLKEYRAVREEAGGFLDLCFDPEKAATVTLQPVERFDLDAAILFADILLIPKAIGQDVWFEKGEGPRLAPALELDLSEADAFTTDALHDVLSPVYETVARVRSALSTDKALIGFAGAPWTVATYMLAGRGVKDPTALRHVAYADPERFDRLIGLLTTATSRYLCRQVEAGADAIQVFDSWAGGLPEDLFLKYCVAPLRRIAEDVKAAGPVPVIGFPRAAGPLYEGIAALREIDAVSIDTGLPAAYAAERLSPHAVVQGGLDPLLLVQGGSRLFDAADTLMAAFEGKPFVFNVGHGLVPQTPPENVAALVAHIRNR